MNIDNNSFSMVQIKRTDVFQTIIERISHLIDNHLKIGDRLPSERELAESLGVSRTSIRQALKVLESMGKVETRVGSGTYVMNNHIPAYGDVSRLTNLEVTKELIRHLIVARAGIERTIFEECFDNITETHIQELRELLQEHAQEFESEADTEDGGLDLSFEAKIAEITGNEILIKLQQQVHQLWIQAWRKYGYAPEKKEILHKQHLEMLDALEHGDKQLMIELIVRHVKKTIN